jgi:anthranilate/para-aminobenzoate synthase component II
VHGKTSPVAHANAGVFAGLANPFEATRYHSLVILEETIPQPVEGADNWEVTAWVDEPVDASQPAGRTRRVVMGLRRAWADSGKAALEGVQFHPESFLTLEGPRLLKNFLEAPAARDA